MGSAIGLREDFDAASLRRLARGSKCANQARRLLSSCEISTAAPEPRRRGSAGRFADRAGLGGAVQCPWPGGSAGSKGSGAPVPA